MAQSALSQQLHRLGVSPATLARLLSVRSAEVGAWLSGSAEVPGPALAYLRVLARLDPAERHAEVGLLRRGGGRLDDGVYRLDYKGLYNNGICLLLLAQGTIAGIDTGGGTYRGTCEPVDGADRHRLSVRLLVPPGQTLVTGARAGPEGAIVDITATLDRPNPVSTAIVAVAGGQVEVALAYLSPLPSPGGSPP
jgi:hypothetical protein